MVKDCPERRYGFVFVKAGQLDASETWSKASERLVARDMVLYRQKAGSIDLAHEGGDRTVEKGLHDVTSIAAADGGLGVLQDEDGLTTACFQDADEAIQAGETLTS